MKTRLNVWLSPELEEHHLKILVMMIKKAHGIYIVKDPEKSHVGVFLQDKNIPVDFPFMAVKLTFCPCMGDPTPIHAGYGPGFIMCYLKAMHFTLLRELDLQNNRPTSRIPRRLTVKKTAKKSAKKVAGKIPNKTDKDKKVIPIRKARVV